MNFARDLDLGKTSNAFTNLWSRLVPTVLRWNGYRFYFYNHEGSEPAHIHVDKGGNSAKFWLEPVALSRNFGYSDRELNRLQDKIVEQQDELQKAWHDYFADDQ